MRIDINDAHFLYGGVIILPIFDIKLPAYALFATVGLMFAVIFLYFRIERIDLSFKEYLVCLSICTVSALLGSRIMFVLAMIPQIEITVSNILYYMINGGIVFYGGMLGVLLGVCLFSKIRKKNTKAIMDTIAPAIPLFHFWARIGCLFAGCCYGIPWSWGVIMQDSPDVIRFPVQFVESVCCLLIFIILLYREKKNKWDNNIFVYLIAYGICRFLLEYFRGDTIRGIWSIGMSTAQIVSAIIIIICLIIIIRKCIKNRAVRYKTDEKDN